jgi:hypothetical protein
MDSATQSLQAFVLKVVTYENTYAAFTTMDNIQSGIACVESLLCEGVKRFDSGPTAHRFAGVLQAMATSIGGMQATLAKTANNASPRFERVIMGGNPVFVADLRRLAQLTLRAKCGLEVLKGHVLNARSRCPPRGGLLGAEGSPEACPCGCGGSRRRRSPGGGRDEREGGACARGSRLPPSRLPPSRLPPSRLPPSRLSQRGRGACPTCPGN